jgi:hypothetical protein
MPQSENLTAFGEPSPRRIARRALAVAALCLCVSAVPAAAAKKKAKAYTVKAVSGAMTLTFTPQVWASLNSSTGTAVGKSATALARRLLVW